MEKGLRFGSTGEGSFQGEGDLATTRYEWGGNWEGSGTMLLTHLSEMWGSYSFTPAFRLLGLGVCTEGRG